MDLDSALRNQIEKMTESTSTKAVIKLEGGASDRLYYRVGDLPHSHVVMVLPQDVGKDDGFDFINVHRYLLKLGMRVPQILRYDKSAAIMVLEDLGDSTFEQALELLEGGKRRDELYGRAIDLLAGLRAAAEKDPDLECVAFTRSFNEEDYNWELHHFREWGMEVWSGKKPSEAERARLDEIFRQISKKLAAAPRGFTLFDYQSRNIMLKDDELVVIDFQDALQGPRQYDLVALLRDSYIELDHSFVDQMIDRYIAVFEHVSGEKLDRTAFKAFFDLLTVQRKLKDAGRFEYINRVKANPSLLPSIPASLRYVKAVLDQRPDLAELREIVGAYVPEIL